MKHLRVIWQTLVLQMKNGLARPMFRFCLFVNPAANTILLYFMFRNSGREDFGTYVILGAGLMALWGCICFSSAGDINRERWYGTTPVIFVAPAGFQLIIFGKILGNTILSLLTLAISFVSAKLLFGVGITLKTPLYAVFALIATVICFIVFSTLIAYLLTLSRKTQLYMNLLEIPIILVCGLAFPVETLPRWVLPLSYALPPTWAVKLLRGGVNGELSAFWQTFGILAAVTAAYGVTAALLYRLIDRQIRKSATLEVV
ncbi:multidrug ABC transporter permease [Clostridia bacterium]|nr:multidrug ABC transporter permease [Clostridia bacterium]